MTIALEVVQSILMGLGVAAFYLILKHANDHH